MLTQNPIIGKAKKKLSGVYARTLYGKNVIQTCPPSRKGKQTPNEIAVCNAFGLLSKLSNQIPASLLNNIFYAAPSGRSRRAEWNHQLSKGMLKLQDEWQYQPSSITKLGGNPTVCNEPYILTPTQNNLRIALSELSVVNNAITTEIPCIILICALTNQCISLLDYTTIDEDYIYLNNLSPTYLNLECYLFPLWKTNVGTSRNEILAYGSFFNNN